MGGLWGVRAQIGAIKLTMAGTLGWWCQFPPMMHGLYIDSLYVRTY